MTEAQRNALYSLKRVHEILGMSRSTVNALVARGFVEPTRGPRNELRFTFQDLMLLRTAEGLRKADVPTRRILKSMATLRDLLPHYLPLTGLRITAVGSEVVVQDAEGPRDVATGQMLLDFEVRPSGSSVVVLAAPHAGQQDSAPRDWFALAQAADGVDAARAEAAYRHAIKLEPGHVHAHINLGALLCESGRCDEAVELMQRAVDAGTSDASLLYNLAIALEDVGRRQDAVVVYRQVLDADPEQADAHYNLGVLLEKLGDGQGAVRHFSAYRRMGNR